MSFEERLREQATQSLDITGQILATGAEVPTQQARVALTLIGGELKQQANRTRQMAQMISLTRFAVREPDLRERIALGILRPLLPAGTLASGTEAAELQPALAADTAQRDAAD